MRYALKELLKIRNGRDHKQLAGGPIPVYGSGGIMRYASSALYSSASILLPRKGTLDNIQYTNKPFWTVDTLYYTEIDESKVDPYFLFYYLKQLDISRLWTGTGVPSMTNDAYYQIQVSLPDLPIQHHIASILGNLDERIEICRKKIALIRSFIERLYDYWFVQFKFPGHECSDMMWNNKAKKNIPQHWTVGVLSDCADITMGQSPDGASYNVDRNGILFFQGATDFGEVFPSERQYTTSPTRYARGGDILLSVRAPVGTMNVAMKDCCIGRGLAAIRGKCCCNSFIEISLKKFAAVFARKNGDGTTFGAITKDELFGLPVIIPEKKILSSFGEIAIPLEKEITVEACKMSKLIEQRDWLLPMLMNGQIVVE